MCKGGGEVEEGTKLTSGVRPANCLPNPTQRSTHAHVHTCTCVHTHTHAHTHTQSRLATTRQHQPCSQPPNPAQA